MRRRSQSTPGPPPRGIGPGHLFAPKNLACAPSHPKRPDLLRFSWVTEIFTPSRLLLCPPGSQAAPGLECSSLARRLLSSCRLHLRGRLQGKSMTAIKKVAASLATAGLRDVQDVALPSVSTTSCISGASSSVRPAFVRVSIRWGQGHRMVLTLPADHAPRLA